MVTAAAGDAVAVRGGSGEGSPTQGPAVHAHVVVDVVDGHAAPAAEQEKQGAASGCRICQLADGDLPLPSDSGSGLLVRLGCACRGDMSAAHRRCAEAWFSVRGNRRCEICGENAANVTGGGGGGNEFMRQWHDTASMDGGGSSKTARFCRSQTLCNILVGCLTIVFILPWFLHNHII